MKSELIYLREEMGEGEKGTLEKLNYKVSE